MKQLPNQSLPLSQPQSGQQLRSHTIQRKVQVIMQPPTLQTKLQPSLKFWNTVTEWIRISPARFRPLVELLALGWITTLAQGASYTWIEAENTASINVTPKLEGWGRTNILSGGQWLQISIAADKVDGGVPAEGVLIQYKFAAPMAPDVSPCQIWARIGYEFVRSPFDWRIDDGPWSRVEPQELTTDLMELSEWCEVAWLKLGEQPLTDGPHTLTFRLPRTKDEKDKTARILFACDALCISAKPFHPNGPHKPDAAWQTARDQQAAAQVFQLPEATAPGARASVTLTGLWEVCRNDEALPPADIAQPMRDVPAQPWWSAIAVPGDRNTLRPDLIFAHRLWYRTRVNVPATQASRGFYIHFPLNNLNSTVVVNGKYCGFFKQPLAGFDMDITAAVQPGTNEVWVGIRDAWYAYSTNPTNPMKLRRRFNLPIGYLGKGFQELAYPIWNHPESGILQPPEFVAVGAPVYAGDVFVKPSVQHQTLTADVALVNPSAKPVRGEVRWQAVNLKSGAVEKTFAPQPFEITAGVSNSISLTGAWANPQLWWPDDPVLYLLRVQIAVAGRVVDISETRFGFREWDWSTKDFKLNGIVWHGWADCHGHTTPQDWLKFYRAKNETVMRFWGTSWLGLSPEQTLNFFDENGVVCRRSGLLDGEMIGYWAVEQDPDLKTESPLKMDLLRNWREQMAAQVRAERNHPSVMIWSIENEFLFINCINLYGFWMDMFEDETTKTSVTILQTDPTRPNMVDGGGATKAQTLPVHGDHYVAGAPDRYPDLAYEANPKGAGRGRWEWDQQRPRFLGEDFFMQGNHPEVAYFEGDSAFTGKPVKGVAIWNRMLQEGYRWAGYGAWQFWLGQNDADGSQYTAFAARAVFSREWNWTFPSGRTVSRPFAIFNDTHSTDPITFAWTLTLNGRKVGGRSQEFSVAPGTHRQFDESLQLPTVKGRQDGEIVLTLSVGGKEVFRDVKPASVLTPQSRDLAGVDGGSLAVFDPQGAVQKFLKSRNIAFTRVDSLDKLPPTAHILVVGQDALDTEESASKRLADYAAGGRRVIVLDQSFPLRYQGLSAAMNPAKNTGNTAFFEDAVNPVAAGLLDRDFFTWGAGRPVYRNAYEKPGRGALSLVQCHDQLRYTALVEVVADNGLLLLCQLAVTDQLDANPVAQQLVLNLLGYAATYRQEFYPVVAAVVAAPQLQVVLDASGLKYTPVPDALTAIQQKTPATAIVAATPAALKTLTSNLPAVKAFTSGGGALVLCGVTPEGLADFNRIVGVDHMLRPGKRERVTLPVVRDRLTAGLTAGDVRLESSQRIFSFQDGKYVVSDMFSHVVDYDEVASFGTSTFHAYDNIVNGFFSVDGWPLIINFQKPEDDSPFPVAIKLQKPQKLTAFTWVGNVLYWPQTKVNLIFDGDREHRLSFDTQPTADPQTFTIDPPRAATEVTLEIAGWMPVPNKKPYLGIDNIYFKAQRSPEFYQHVHAMLNVGGLMHYTEGRGHIVLCNLLFKDREEVAENTLKKQTILSTILRNLHAQFAVGQKKLAGLNLTYEPVSIATHCTQYRDEQGWFGDKKFTFKDLPSGNQQMAGAKFNIYDFATSPVPNVLMLAGRGIPGQLPAEIHGIAVNRKADAIFFLQAARIDKRRSPAEIKEGRSYELVRYAIHYADGKQVEIPVQAEVDVEDYHQKTSAIIPGAQIAWVKAYENSGFSAVAYSQQWSNPRPDVTITAIDILPGKDNCGVPAVLAITTARQFNPSYY